MRTGTIDGTTAPKPLRLDRRVAQDTAGQTLVEFAFIVPMILMLALGTVEMARHYYVRLTMQHAVAEAARFAVTGRIIADTTGTPLTRAQSITQIIGRRAATLSVDLDGITIDPPDGGGPGDIVTVNADFGFNFIAPWLRGLVPNGALDFSASTALKNEPFFPPIPAGP